MSTARFLLLTAFALVWPGLTTSASAQIPARVYLGLVAGAYSVSADTADGTVASAGLAAGPDLRYDYGSIGDEINNAWRASTRVWCRF